jgi:hypothetical protein
MSWAHRVLMLMATMTIGVGAGPLALAQAPAKKPSILVIWGDDIGRDNISAYSTGIMGYQTQNIDRIAKGGAIFTDSYAQQKAFFRLVQHLLAGRRS